MDKYWNYVYGFQLKRVENEIDAEDISIQTFAKAFDKIQTFDTQYSFPTWLITISKNIHIDMVRSSNKSYNREESAQKQIQNLPDDTPTAEDKLIIEQNLSHLLDCIRQLHSPYREMIQLRFLQEKSYKEISQITGLTLSNVKVALLRAKKLLADIIRINKKNI